MRIQRPHSVSRKRPKRIPALLCVALALPMLLVACGGDDDDSATSTATSATGATTPTTTATETSTSTPQAPTATTAASATATTPAATPTTAATASATTAAPTPTGTASADTLTLSVYFIRDEKISAAHRVVPHTLQVAAAAMTELLKGPTEQEKAVGMTSSIPEGTEFLGVTLNNGIATVDLSGEYESGGGSVSMATRLAQVVFTLTQFPTIQQVQFTLDGEPVEVFGGEGIILDHPVGRDAYEQWTPTVFVESPTVGDEVSSPLRVWGTANTFEAAFMITLKGPDGATLYEQPQQATSGTGTRGTFDVTIDWSPPVAGDGTLVVWEVSAKDGSPIHVLEIPIKLAK